MNLDNFGFNIFILIAISLTIMLAIAYWLLNQLFQPTIQPKQSKQKKVEPKPSAPKSDGSSKTQNLNTLDPEWVSEQHPNAVLIDAKSLIEAYKKGQRDFNNVFPSAVGPYENYLRWTTLDGANFSRAMLSQAPFDGTSLIGTNFNGAFLESASFKAAILRQADLSWADLRNADLTGADLTGSKLNFTALKGANLTNAILIGVTISDEQLESASSLKGAILPDGSRHN